MRRLSTLGLGIVLAVALGSAAPILLAPGTASGYIPNPVAMPTGTIVGTASGAYLFPASPAADISGTFVETVYADPGNVFAPGDETWVLQITVGANTNNAGVERATLGYFPSVKVQASYLNGTASAPVLATRDAAGGVIGFNFAGLMPGQVETLVVYTNWAGQLSNGTVSIINGTSGYAAGLQPIPEPVSIGLLGGGLALLGLLRLHRK